MSGRWLMLTVGGLGAIRPAPGTWGSTPPPLLALAILWIVSGGGVTSAERVLLDTVLLVVAIVFAAACVVWGEWAEQRFGSKDPSSVVADEVAGQTLPLLALPWLAFGSDGALAHNLTLAAVAFVSFRFFDIVKVPPARGLQRVQGGWGILIDDLVAGVYAAVVTQIVARLVLA